VFTVIETSEGGSLGGRYCFFMLGARNWNR